MRTASAVLLLAALLLFPACRVHDIRTVVIQAPGVRCGDCAGRVRSALAALDGVKVEDLAFDLERGAITVTYDSMVVAIKNLEFAVAAAGYAVDAKPFPLPADPAARAALPETCRAHAR